MFYRFSWELYVYNILDELIKEGYIKYVDIPKRIPYYFHNFNRHYFPDIKITFADDDFYIIEIKPKNKTKDEINKVKFQYAAELYKDKFIVLTETEIFNLNIKDKIKNKFNGYENYLVK